MISKFDSKIVSKFASALLVLMALSASITSFAGRPLTVDDASVNDTGEGHVEAW